MALLLGGETEAQRGWDTEHQGEELRCGVGTGDAIRGL